MVWARQWALVVSAGLAVAACDPRLRQLGPEDAGTAGAGRAQPTGTNSVTAAVASARGEPEAKRTTARCSVGEVAVLVQPGEETCVVECRSSAACPPGWSCDGEGPLSRNGIPGEIVGYCRASGRPRAAGDAGAPQSGAVFDAGKSGPAAPTQAPQAQVADAAAPPARRLDVKATGGHCPAGYQPCGAICRLGCARDSDCGLATAHCQEDRCLGPGALPCGK
jgi:hypothetical protein